MRLSAALLAVVALLLSSCAKPAITEESLDRGRAAATLDERAETVAMWLEGDFAADGGRELHVRRMPEFGRGLHVVETDPARAGSPLYNGAWIIVAADGNLEIQQWRITRPERYAEAWKDAERLKELTMYDLRRVEGGAAIAEEDSPDAAAFAFAAPEALSVKAGAAGVALARGESIVYRRLTPLRDLRPTP